MPQLPIQLLVVGSIFVVSGFILYQKHNSKLTMDGQCKLEIVGGKDKWSPVRLSDREDVQRVQEAVCRQAGRGFFS